MSEAAVKVKVPTVLPYKNGRHVPHPAGDVVPLSKLTDSVARALSSGDRFLTSVLEKA